MNINELQDIFYADRPAMMDNNQDLLHLGVLLEGEMHEFLDAWLDFLSDPSEGSLYEVGQESADIGLYLNACLRCIGLSLEYEMREKIAYNTARFTSRDFTHSPYSEAYPSAKRWVVDTRFKQQFAAIPRS